MCRARLAYVRAHLQTARFATTKSQVSNECSPTSRARSHLVRGKEGEEKGGLYFFAHFESQLRGLFEVPTIPNSKFKMRNNFFS